MDVKSVLLYGAFLTVLIDFVLSLSWAKFYFRFGIPIMAWNGRLEKLRGCDLAAIADKASYGFETCLLSNSELALRDKMRETVFTPMLHGYLRYDQKHGGFRITAYLDYYVVPMILAFILVFSDIFRNDILLAITILFFTVGAIMFLHYRHYRNLIGELQKA